jgi:GGDEF domain-containing protein
MDLDEFKEVNDTLGHMSGDLLLKEVAARLKAALEHKGFLFRMGGAVWPDDGTNPINLIRNADTALYQSKNSGRNQVTFYKE